MPPGRSPPQPGLFSRNIYRRRQCFRTRVARLGQIGRGNLAQSGNPGLSQLFSSLNTSSVCRVAAGSTQPRHQGGRVQADTDLLFTRHICRTEEPLLPGCARQVLLQQARADLWTPIYIAFSKGHNPLKARAKMAPPKKVSKYTVNVYSIW